MKKTLFVSLAILTVAAIVPQTAEAGVGIKGGLAFSNLNLNAPVPLPYSFDTLRSPIGGLFFGASLGPIALQPELLYVRMGAKYIEDLVPVELRLQYVQLPLLLKLNVMPAGPIRPNLFAGPYGAFRLSARQVVAGISVDVDSRYQKTDYGVVIGAGLDLKLGVLSLTIDGRYSMGLANVYVPVSAEDTTTVKNKAFMVLAGISF